MFYIDFEHPAAQQCQQTLKKTKIENKELAMSNINT